MMGPTERRMVEDQADFLRANPDLAMDQDFARACETWRALGESLDAALGAVQSAREAIEARAE